MNRSGLLAVVLCSTLFLASRGYPEWQNFTMRDGLVSNSVTWICEDGSGNIWFGTSGGVSRYDGVNWRTFTAVMDLPTTTS